MSKKLFSVMLSLIFALTAFGQSLDVKMAQGDNAREMTAKGKINLPASSVYGVKQNDLFKWMQGNRYSTPRMKSPAQPPRKVGAAECFPNDPYIYTALSSTYHSANEGVEQGQVFGLYLNEKSTLYKEMDGKLLPSGDYGTRYAYVRVADNWYCFSSKHVDVVDAKTGEIVKEVETDVANAGRGASYDYNRKKFYVINFDGLIEIDAETFESTNLGALSGGFVTCLACGPDGNIYYITYAGALYKFDYATKECSEVLSNIKLKQDDGSDLNWQNQGMTAAFDWNTGLFYYTFLDNSWVDYLASTDITGTAAPRKMYTFTGTEMTMMGLYIPYGGQDVPAAATGINFSDGTLTFTVPTQTVSGEALSGALTAYITVNGEETAYDVTAGEIKTIEIEASGSLNISIEVGNAAGRSAERRVNMYVTNAPKFYPNDPYIYTALSSTYHSANEGVEQGQVFGLYLNEKSLLYKEMDGKLLPSGDYGTRFPYVRVGDYWYCFSAKHVDVVDAKTGEIVKAVETDVANAGRGASYDYNRKKFYVINFDGLIEIDAETFESTNLGALSGGFVTCVACGPDGNIYYITYAGALYKFDYATKECSEVLSNIKLKQDDGSDLNWQNQGMTAAFDWNTGLFYYTFLDNSWVDYLAITDITGAAAPNKVYTFTGTEMTMMGLYIPYGGQDVPAAATGINFSDGMLTFTVPTETVSGEALSGALTAYITVNGEETAYDVTAGEEKTIELPLNGTVVISIEIGNAAGRSAERRINTFIGSDAPTHVTDLVLAREGQDFVLTWKAPTTSLHGGAFDDSSLNYTVTRMPDNVVVATGLTETTFTDPVPAKRDRYYYIVDAFAGSIFGEGYASNIVSGGTEYILPFKEEFYDEDDFVAWTTIDQNGDGATWHYQHPWNAESGYAYLTGNGITNTETGFVSTHNDDYFISLPFELKKGTDYRLSYRIFNLTLYTERMEVLLGKGNQVTGNETVIRPNEILEEQDYVQIFHVEEDGYYTLMFHSITEGNSISTCLDDVALEIYAAFDGPGAVTDVTVTAGAEGALTNTLTFTAPTKTYQGGELTSISRIDIYRNGEATAAKTFDNPAPGAELTWVDDEVEQGTVNYRILPFNENGQGEEYITENWVGLDIPVKVANVVYRMDENLKATASWDAVGGVGAHGGYVNPADVKYALYRYDQWNWSDPWQRVTEESSETSATDTDYTIYWGQEYVSYIVVASNAAGLSEGTEFGIVLGEPYETPYTESFAWGFASKDPWTLKASSYYYAWTMETGSGLAVKPYDGDEGMLQFKYIQEESNTQTLQSPRVSLTQLENGEFSFFMYHGFEAEPEDLILTVYTNTDDAGWVKAAEIPYNNGGQGWSRHSVGLTTGNNVQFMFGAYAADASASIYLDNIQVAEGNDYDVAIENINIASKRISAGTPAEVNVEIANYGLKTAEGYSIVLLRDGEEMMTLEGPAMEGSSTAKVTFEVPTTRHDESKMFLFSAKVNYEADSNEANNESGEVRLFVTGSTLPTAENLRGTETDGKLTLTWDAPSSDEITDPVTDDFEAYENFIINGIGDWTTYDGDGAPTVYFNAPEIPNVFEPKAWQVWDPVAAGFNVETFDVLLPHSGVKYLASWAASDGYSQTVPSDDWLISSEVTGGSDISFWYRMPNANSDPQVFEILYSTTDLEPENFTVLDRDSLIGTTEWTRFEYTLPSDARYFAIRNCSYGNYVVAFLDDIEYTPLFGATSKLTLKGYNVYRDDEFIGFVESNSFDDIVIDGVQSVYNVTAVWAEGESNISNDYVSSGVNGITSVATDGEGGRYYTIGGVRTEKPVRGIIIVNRNGKSSKTVVK